MTKSLTSVDQDTFAVTGSTKDREEKNPYSQRSNNLNKHQ